MVMPLRVAFVEWPEAFSTDHAQWDRLKESLAATRPDILVTNELPFGPWLADRTAFSEDEANRSIRAHEAGAARINRPQASRRHLLASCVERKPSGE